MPDLGDFNFHFDPLDEKWRWCAYCGADCWPDQEYQEHDDDCPTVTGRFPVDDVMLEHGSACCRCEKPLKGFYRMVRDEGDTDDETPTYVLLCEDCAMQIELLGASVDD